MKKYGIDIDGVLRNFDRALAHAMRLAPIPLSYKAMSWLKAPDSYEKSTVVGGENWRWFWQEAAANLRVLEKAYPFRDEVQHLGKLPGEVFLITSQPKHLRDQTYAWLARQHAAPEGVFHVSKPEEKVEFINCLGVDVFVDDRLETLVGLVGNTKAKLCLFDQPWNRDGQVHASITRIKSLKELL